MTNYLVPYSYSETPLLPSPENEEVAHAKHSGFDEGVIGDRRWADLKILAQLTQAHARQSTLLELKSSNFFEQSLPIKPTRNQRKDAHLLWAAYHAGRSSVGGSGKTYDRRSKIEESSAIANKYFDVSMSTVQAVAALAATSVCALSFSISGAVSGNQAFAFAALIAGLAASIVFMWFESHRISQ